MTRINGLPAKLPAGELFRSADPREYRLMRTIGAEDASVLVRNVRRRHGAPGTSRVARLSFYDSPTYTTRAGEQATRTRGFYLVRACFDCECCEAEACGPSPDACTPMASPVMRIEYGKPGGCPCNTARP